DAVPSSRACLALDAEVLDRDAQVTLQTGLIGARLVPELAHRGIAPDRTVMLVAAERGHVLFEPVDLTRVEVAEAQHEGVAAEAHGTAASRIANGLAHGRTAH